MLLQAPFRIHILPIQWNQLIISAFRLPNTTRTSPLIAYVSILYIILCIFISFASATTKFGCLYLYFQVQTFAVTFSSLFSESSFSVQVVTQITVCGCIFRYTYILKEKIYALHPGSIFHSCQLTTDWCVRYKNAI